MSAKYQDYPIYTYDQPVTYNDFTGGINTDPSNEHLLPNEMRDCLNMEFLSGALVKRKGGKKICNIKLEEDDGEVEEEGITQGIFLFADNSASGSITHIIIARCGKLYSGIYSVNKYKSCPNLTLKRLHIRTKIKKRGEDLFDKTNVMYGLPNSKNDDGYAICHILKTNTETGEVEHEYCAFNDITSSNTEYYYEMCFQTREKIEAAHINNPETQCNEMYLATGTRIVKITEGTDRKLYAEPLSPYLLNGVEIENIGFNDLCPIPTYGTRSGDSDAAATSMYGSLQVTPKLKTDASGAFLEVGSKHKVEFNIAPQISYAQHESTYSYAMRWSHKANSYSPWIVKAGETFSDREAILANEFFEKVHVENYSDVTKANVVIEGYSDKTFATENNVKKKLSDLKKLHEEKVFIKKDDQIIFANEGFGENYPGYTEVTNLYRFQTLSFAEYLYTIDSAMIMKKFGDKTFRFYFAKDLKKSSAKLTNVQYSENIQCLTFSFGNCKFTLYLPSDTTKVNRDSQLCADNIFKRGELYYKAEICKHASKNNYAIYIGFLWEIENRRLLDFEIKYSSPYVAIVTTSTNQKFLFETKPNSTSSVFFFELAENHFYKDDDVWDSYDKDYTFAEQRTDSLGTEKNIYEESGSFYLCKQTVPPATPVKNLSVVKNKQTLSNLYEKITDKEQFRLDIGKDFICNKTILPFDSEQPYNAGDVVSFNNCLYECMNDTTTSKGDPETNKADWMKRTDFETIYVEKKDAGNNTIIAPTIDYKPLSIFGSYVGRAETPANLKEMWESFMDSDTVRELFAEGDATDTTISKMPTITPNENFTRIHSCTKVTGDGNKLLFYGDRSQSGWWFKTIVSNPAYITKRGCLSFKTSKDEYVEKVIPFQGNLVVFANSKRLGGSIHIVRGNGDDYDDGSQYFSPYSRRTVNAEVSTTNADTVKICDNLLIFKYFNRLYYIQASDLNNEVITVNTCNDRILSESEDLKIPWDDDSCIAETTDKCYSLVWKEKFAVDEFGNEYVEHPAMRIKMYYKMFNQMKDRNTLMPWLRDESNIFNSSYIFSMEGQPVYLYKDALITFGDQVYTDLGDDYECYAKLRGFDLEHPQLYKLISNIVLYYHRDHDKTCDVKLDLTNEAGFEMLSNAGKRSLSDLRAMRAQSGLNLMRANEKFSLASGVVTDTKVINTPYKFPCLNVSPTIRANSSGGLFSIESITFNYTTIDAMDTTASDLYSRIIRPDLL